MRLIVSHPSTYTPSEKAQSGTFPQKNSPRRQQMTAGCCDLATIARSGSRSSDRRDQAPS